MGRLLDLAYACTLLPHYAWHRWRTGKYGSDAPEKLGHLPAHLAKGDRPRVWVHGVSVGETIAARVLVKAFREARPDWDVVFSTTTATGREVAVKHHGAEHVFYFPLDLSSVVRHVFDTVKPDLIILMELEVWPHFLEEAKRRGIPVAVANVRITERSERRFARFPNWTKRMLGLVDLWCSQSDAYAATLARLGVDPSHIHTVGSIKYDGLDLAEKPEEAARLRRELGVNIEPLLVAGSTHEGEEEQVLSIFARIREQYPDTRLVLVPRHPERCPGVQALIPAQYRVHRRSAGPAPTGTDIVLGDTMGELANLYRAADLVFVGGSLCDTGGHNMLEPAAFAKPILYGPCVFNFAEPAQALEDRGAAIRLSGPGAQPFLDLLADPERARAMGLQAKEVVTGLQGAAARTLALILPFAIQRNS